MESIKETIIELRPNLSKQSVATYTSILKNLYTKVFGSETFDLNKFNETKKILEHLKTLEPNKRKTVLSALVILTDKKEYREQMLTDINKYNEEQHKQEQSEKQSESWVHGDEIKKLISTFEKEIKLLYKKQNLTITDLQTIQNYIILCLLSGQEGFPPRRSLDFTEMRIRNYEKNVHNIFNGKDFIFNNYKTVKTYQTQQFPVPKLLGLILKKWIKINQNDYLLVDRKGLKLSPVTLNQRLNKIFGGKNVGVNILRHSYLTEHTKSVTDLREIYERAEVMGHSPSQALLYIKK